MPTAWREFAPFAPCGVIRAGSSGDILATGAILFLAAILLWSMS